MQKLNDAKTFLEHTLGPDKYNEQRHQIFQLIKLSFDPARQTEAENKLFLTLADEKHKEMSNKSFFFLESLLHIFPQFGGGKDARDLHSAEITGKSS